MTVCSMLLLIAMMSYNNLFDLSSHSTTSYTTQHKLCLSKYLLLQVSFIAHQHPIRCNISFFLFLLRTVKCWVENNLIVFSAELHRAFNILIVTVNFSVVVAAVANFMVGIIVYIASQSYFTKEHVFICSFFT